MYKSLPLMLCGYAAVLMAGCEHLTESRVVQRFAESIQEHDLARMKAEASRDFEDKAVKGGDTFRALKLLELPEGLPKVTGSVDVRADTESNAVLVRTAPRNLAAVQKLISDGRLTADGAALRVVFDV